ncbi:nucleic acid binding protein [Isoalcanivorax pacificus W11-5]|uniref:Nucleic acid binding protein n=1 Tax=Isoalcanivorax pacificus W11-5 TaxID=391936 RepID=A0A0B4XMU5_9GAMM|nr:putative toxin-antitoxin system toxin component, PIN family [Isoalcanivorax pacificus]AJD47657.1 nucleic acid binding protein [Isoalcanivorax pacificus W11-5]
MHYRADTLWVVDTCVLVSGVLSSGGPPARILDQMLTAQVRYALSLPLLAEYRTVLLRPKLLARHSLAVEEVDQLLEALILPAVIVDPVPPATLQAPDPGDQHLWDLLCYREDLTLLTGDRLLLEQAPESLSLMPPTDWVARYLAD